MNAMPASADRDIGWRFACDPPTVLSGLLAKGCRSRGGAPASEES